MVQYEKRIIRQKIYIPKSIRNEFGEEIEVVLQPNKNCFLVYPKGIDKEKLLKGIDLIRAELEE